MLEIPSEVWAQYPLIVIFVLLVAWLAKYWIANEREWRTFFVEQLKGREADHRQTIQLVSENHKNLILMIEDKHKEQMEFLRDTFDAEITRVSIITNK